MAASIPRAPGPLDREQHERRERILTQPAPSRRRGSADAVVVKRDELFLLTDPSGDVPRAGDHALGLYLEDRRYLAGYELTIDGRPPTVLGFSSARPGNARHELLHEGELGPSRGALAVTRRREIEGEVLLEHIDVRNYGAEIRRVCLTLAYEPGFEDVFVLKGFTDERGRTGPGQVSDATSVRFGYEGLDGSTCALLIGLDPTPAELDHERARFALEIAPGSAARIEVRITPVPDRRRDVRASGGLPAPEPHDPASAARIVTSNALLDRALRTAFTDLSLLRSRQDGLHFYEAGVPWFATLFGRDAAMVCLQTLAYDQHVSGDTLRLLARYQAQQHDPYRDAEPGKILHELRSGELARAGLIPQSPAYYGTIDATLLFLILLEQHFAWTGDTATIRELEPALRAALAWTIELADHDGDGYLDYVGAYRNGLINQGWKDSGDAIVMADGALAEPPVALSEVQGYAYRAWVATARLLRTLGDGRAADALAARAADLRTRFERDFWWSEEGIYLLALTGKGPARVVTSNAGQVLWAGIASRDRAAAVAARLMRPDMSSGWGIRTLSADAAGFDPTSYHRGTVWPHDNALILAGFRRYGEDAAACRVFEQIFAAAAGFRETRLPELWSGYAREDGEERPVGYPVACVPQAWAAGSLPYAITSLLGLEADASARRLIVRRPVLPPSIDAIELAGVRVAGERIDLRFERRGARVHLDATAEGGVEVVQLAELAA